MSSRQEQIGRAGGEGWLAFALGCVALIVLLAGVSGCRTAPPAAPIDLTQPGWTVRQGQAVWRATRGADGVAGELVVATQADGSCWVQFSKPPFNLVTAQRQAGRWHIELQQGRKQYGGRGTPPSRFIWFQLAGAAAGQQTDAGWSFSRAADGSWILIHPATGEKLEGYLSP